MGIDQNILQLQVAVAHAVQMHVLHCGHDLPQVVLGLGFGERAGSPNTRKHICLAQLEVEHHAGRSAWLKAKLLRRTQHAKKIDMPEPPHEHGLVARMRRVLLAIRHDLGSDKVAARDVARLKYRAKGALA